MTKQYGLRSAARESLDSSAADVLRQAILSSQIAQNSRLTEQQLSDELNVSRGTIRSALHQLATEGLVVRRPFSGWNVMSLTSRDAWELSTLRASLEGLGARITAETLDAAKRRTILAAWERLSETTQAADISIGAVNRADIAFHKAVIDLAGHSRLSEQYQLVGQQVLLCIASSTVLQVKHNHIQSRHKALVDAILEGGPSQAEEAFTKHCLESGAEIIAHLRKEETAQ